MNKKSKFTGFIEKYWIWMYCFIGLVVSVKRIFVDYNIDVEYALATSYRQLTAAGADKMFTEMMEPHQTSAFLATALMFLYESLFHTTTGIALYMQVCGVLIHTGVVIALYFTLKDKISLKLLVPMCIFLFVMRPKNLPFPEFSNMQIWFSILVFLFLVKYWESEERNKWYLFLASVCICLETLSYPSCAILLLGVYFVQVKFFKNWKKNCLWMTIICAGIGLFYALFFISRMGFSGFVEALLRILNSDKSHGSESRWLELFKYVDYKAMSIEYIGTFILVILLMLIFYKLIKKQAELPKGLLYKSIVITSIVAVIEIIILFFFEKTYSRNNYGVCLLIIMVLGLFGLKYCSRVEKMLVTMSYTFSLCSFIGTLCLTNMNWIVTTLYMMFGVAFAFIPIVRKLQQLELTEYTPYRIIHVYTCLFSLICILVPISYSELYNTIFEINGIMKKGPAIGIFTDYMGAYMYNCSYEDSIQYIQNSEKVLYVTEDKVSTIGYLFDDAQVSAYSTICTANFDEVLLEYWERNPHKQPDVIAMSCWYGDMHVSEDNVLFDWMEEDGRSYTYQDGRYWRYYRITYQK